MSSHNINLFQYICEVKRRQWPSCPGVMIILRSPVLHGCKWHIQRPPETLSPLPACDFVSTTCRLKLISLLLMDSWAKWEQQRKLNQKRQTHNELKSSSRSLHHRPLADQQEKKRAERWKSRSRLTPAEISAPLRQKLSQQHSPDSFQFSYGILIFNRVIIVVAYLMSPTIRPD